TEIVYSTPADFDYALIKLNKIDPSLEISKILKCENWNTITASCVGNFFPIDIPFIDYGDYIVINITNFSAYAGGAGYNASLFIWDSSDDRTVGINETIFFYANYSTYPEGIPINDSNGICLAFFSFENRPGFSAEMQFNYSSMLWETSFLTTEDMVGINNFTVNCSSSNYDNLTATDEFIIQNISVNIITNCTEINQPGIYRLNSNLIAQYHPSFNGACIRIISDNVIFDCNNYAIIDNPTNPIGNIIKLSKPTPTEPGYNVSIKNCEIYDVYGTGIEIGTFNNVNLENIKILKDEENYNVEGIDISNSNNISINNYYCKGYGIQGLKINNSNNIGINNYHYEGYDGYYGIMISNSNNTHINNYYYKGNTNFGLRIDESNNIIINNYYHEGNAFNAIEIIDSSNLIARNINITNIYYYDEEGISGVSGGCIYASWLSNSIFDKGFLNCVENLILSGSNINVSNFYIVNNISEISNECDICISGKNIVVENNIFEDTDTSSLNLIEFYNSENIFIRNNDIKGKPIGGISSDNFEIYNNTFYYNPEQEYYIIYLSFSNDGIIKDNKFICDYPKNYSHSLNNSSFISIYNYNDEIIKFENNYFKWGENEFYFDALIINTTSIYAYKGSPPSAPNNLIPLNKSLIIYQDSVNGGRIDLNISFVPLYNNISYYKIDLLNDSGWLEQYTEIINNKAYTYFETPESSETYVLLSLFGEAPAECTCTSCEDCMNKLNDPSCTEVKLINDIINYSRICINNPENFSNKVFDCQGHTIDGNYRTGSGIYLNGKTGNTIKNCIITDFYNGIYLASSSNNILTNNTASSNRWNGIFLWSSSNNILTNNTASSNWYGIYLDSSSNNTLRNNNLINNTYNFNIYRTTLENYYHNIDTSNKVNGRPILYLTNKTSSCENIIIDKNYPEGEPGFVGLVGCNNITVKDLDLYNNRYGIMLVATSNSFIYNNSVHNNIDGIWLHLASNNNIISNNIVFYQDSYGIRIGGHETQEIGCNNTIIENNTVFNNGIGITPRFGKNYNLIIRNNNVSDNNEFNILIRSVDNVKIENNIIENRNCLFLADFGLSTGNITNIIISNNKLSGCWNGIYLETENNQDYIINVSIINNSITNGTYGTYISSNRIINPQLLSNYICFNDNYDIINYNDLTGNNNTCDKTYNYNDTDKEGCTYSCPIAIECTCNSCEDCMNKLNDPSCTEVKLINDIINIDRNPCINISFSNKIFDCQNYSIIKNETLILPEYTAILINPTSNITIKNCNIGGFDNAILLRGVRYNISQNTFGSINIINNTLFNNSKAITYSEEIEIYDSQIENNTLIDNIFGIKFKGSNNIIRNNKIRGKYNNATHKETIGIMIYQPSRSTLIDNNIVCKHVYDIKADTDARGIQNYCDVAINFSDSNASGCKKKTDINFDIKSYLLKSNKAIPIIKFDVILYSNLSAKARLYSKYNWQEEWQPNFGASSCIYLPGWGGGGVSLPILVPPPQPVPPSPLPSPLLPLCSSSGELAFSEHNIFAQGYGIVSPTEPCMEGRESYNITFQDAFPYKDCSNNTIMKFEYYKIEFENFCNKKESDVYLRKTNELIKSPSKQTGINFVSFTTDIRYGGIAVASDGKMAIVTPEDEDCTIQLPVESKGVSPWITLSDSSELLTSCISRKLQEEKSSARLIYTSYWDEERKMYVGHPASLFANAYIKDFPIKLGKSYFVDVNKNLTFTQFGKLPPESIWHEIKAIGREKINIITLTP
ncbi:MAG: right-handed parallel beta-helix repeat-containing protein, partial [Candidatus Pacearchaeota archaeon]